MTDETKEDINKRDISQYQIDTGEKPEQTATPERADAQSGVKDTDKNDTDKKGANKKDSATSPEQLPTKEQFFEILMPVQDPEIRIGIVDLGLIYDIIVEDDNTVVIKMTLTTPSCPYGEMLIAQVQDLVSRVPGVKEAKIDLVWEPIWDPREMASDYAKDQLGIW